MSDFNFSLDSFLSKVRSTAVAQGSMMSESKAGSGTMSQGSMMSESNIKTIFEAMSRGPMMSGPKIKTGSETMSQDAMMSESKMESEPETISQDSMMSESKMESKSETMSQDSVMSKSKMEQDTETPSDNYTSADIESKSMTAQATDYDLATSSTVSEDWLGGYKLEVDLTAQSPAKNWQATFKLPYEIRDAYGVDLTDNENGSYTISGQNGQKSLKQGQTIQPIFIIEDDRKEAKMPEFMATKTKMPEADMEKSKSMIVKTADYDLATSSTVSEDWLGGYKLEVDLTAQSPAKNWQATFKLPYEIRDAYGVDLTDNGNGSYTISGQNEQKSLKQGQTIQPIFIIEDDRKEAKMPEFMAADSMMPETKEKTKDNSTKPEAEPKKESENTPISDSTNSNQDAEISPKDDSQIIVEDPQGESVQQQGKFAYGEALQKNFLFYEANRSGDLGAYHRLEWRTDATTEDGSSVGQDLEGGYFDAGDHVKFGQPMAASVNMLAWGGVEYREAYEQVGQYDELLEAVKWGTDYFLKAHEVNGDGETARLWVQVGEGQYDHKIWTAPSELEGNTPRNAFAVDAGSPGSDVAASTAAALAASSMLFDGVDDAYAEKLLKNAEQLYEFAEEYPGNYSDSVDEASPYYTSYSGYYDELASGAAWLYKATGDKSYLSKAEEYFKNDVGELGDWSWATDDHSYGAAVLLAQESKDPIFKDMVEEWSEKWINGSENIQYTDGGFAFRAEWGSVPTVSSAAFLIELYNDTVREDSRYSEFASSQVDYILGDNPRDYSYMIGFGENYPERPHHRGSSPDSNNDPTEKQENILYGAIVGGPDAADDFAHTDRRDDFITNEVGISYNAPFASALIQQYDDLGGDPLSKSELDQLIGVDANGVGI